MATPNLPPIYYWTGLSAPVRAFAAYLGQLQVGEDHGSVNIYTATELLGCRDDDIHDWFGILLGRGVVRDCEDLGDDYAYTWNCRPKCSSYVYMMRDNSTGLIKIGMTRKDPEFRERTLLSQCPSIQLIASKEGDIEEERRLHHACAGVRQRGEWFDLGDGLVHNLAHAAEFWVEPR